MNPTGDFWLLIVLTGGICAVVALYLQQARLRSRPPLPPGPSGFPLIGNLLDMPKDHEWLHWAKHKDKYGPITTVTALNTRVIIINNLQIALDLLETRSQIYSNRPMFPFAGEIIGWNRQMILSQYNDRFRLMRKYVKAYIGTKGALEQHKHIQEVETKYFCARILQDPSSVIENIRRTAGAIFLRLSHGYTLNTTGPDPLVDLVENAGKEFHAATLPGAWFIDNIPFMRYLPEWWPGQHFKKVGRVFREHNFDQAHRPVEFVRRQMARGTEQSSFVSTLLKQGLNAYEEDVVTWSANALYGGGTDTTTAALTTFFLAMVRHPEVQKAAHEELDRVVGHGRLPGVDDRPQLPYIEALLLETLRYHPVGPMGIPHSVTQDDVYNNMFIPKNSIIIPNIWLFAHDPKVYPNPDIFDPTRFFNTDHHSQMDPQIFVYGFGRRACPGRELANANMFLSIAMFLSVFEITRAVDENGIEIVPPLVFESGTVTHPVPFPFKIKLRSVADTALILSVWEDYPSAPTDAPEL